MENLTGQESGLLTAPALAFQEPSLLYNLERWHGPQCPFLSGGDALTAWETQHLPHQLRLAPFPLPVSLPDLPLWAITNLASSLQSGWRPRRWEAHGRWLWRARARVLGGEADAETSCRCGPARPEPGELGMPVPLSADQDLSHSPATSPSSAQPHPCE